jgi:hypothetical protein
MEDAPAGLVLAYTPRMFVKRTMAALVPLLVFATTTCGVGCDLRCSLGEFFSVGQEAVVTGAEQSTGSPDMNMADSAIPSGPCHRMAVTEKPRPAAQARCTHATAATLCPHESCRNASALVSQFKNAQIQYLAFEVLSARLSLSAVARVQAAMGRSGFISPPPPSASLRI